MEDGEATYLLARSGGEKRLCVMAPAGSMALGETSGDASARQTSLLVCPLTHANAAAFRAALPWLRPGLLGLRTSAGCGDRMGLATPRPASAARSAGGIGMIYAQQWIHEMTRTGRSPDDVMDDATWGIFQEGSTRVSAPMPTI